MTVLTTNCEPDWSDGVCRFGNLCGIASYTFWFVVLWPQILKNYRLRSVEGLSVLWATANFTASLVNCFFVFNDSITIKYVRVVSVYKAVVELAVLTQFWVYSKHNVLLKLYYACGCFILWAGCVTLDLSVAVKSVDKVQWIAVVLWAVQTFPQILLNIKLRSTGGQATASIYLALVTKTLFLIYVCLIAVPLQYVVMMYISTSLTYINAIQVIWYAKSKPKHMVQVSYYGYGSNATPDEDLLEANECEDDEFQTGESLEQSYESNAPSIEEMSSIVSWKNYQFESYVNRVKALSKALMAMFMLWLAVLVVLFVCLCLRTGSPLGIFAPVFILLVLVFGVLHRDYKEGSLPCCVNRYQDIISTIM